jgi:hypothetical protein
MKDWPEEWKVLVVSKKVPKGKQQIEVGPSHMSNNPTSNIRKATEHKKETWGAQ